MSNVVIEKLTDFVDSNDNGWYWFIPNSEAKGNWQGPFPTKVACVEHYEDWLHQEQGELEDEEEDEWDFEFCTKEAPEDTPCLDDWFHRNEMDVD